MQRKKGDIVELEITALAFMGRGIGKHEGLTVFVDATMPGDKVRASFTKIKEKFAEAQLVEIVEESSYRVKPKCPYSEICGGCQLQFMPYDQQVNFKRQHVIDALERIGKIYDPPVAEVIPCEEEFYYRNKMEFTFGYDADMKFAFGMHMPGRRYDKIDLRECHLQSEYSYKLVNLVRDFVVEKNWPPFRFSDGEGLLRSFFVREGKRTGEVMINLTTGEDLPDNFEEDLKVLVDKILEVDTDEKRLVSFIWTTVISRRGHRRQEKERVIYGKRVYSEKMILDTGDELTFEILPQAFFQVNTFQGEKLYSEVVKLATQESHKVIFDLYCGTGTIGLFLAKHCEQVYGIELNEDAVKIARENAQKNAIFNIDFYTGDVGKLLKSLRDKPTLIVVDPPRAGLTNKVMKDINDFGADKLIYVSCNPSTLARDCDELKQYGYSVKSIQPVDMFPHTFHIENVCLLER